MCINSSFYHCYDFIIKVIAKLQISPDDLPVQQKKSGLLYIRVVGCRRTQRFSKYDKYGK